MKRKISTPLFLTLLLSVFTLFNVKIAVASLSTPTVDVKVDSNFLKLRAAYSNAYGFSEEEMTPVLIAPQTELPLILHVAKKAMVNPATIWALRQQGEPYSNILSLYKIPYAGLFTLGVDYKKLNPVLASLQAQLYQPGLQLFLSNDRFLVQLGQVKLFTDYLKIDPWRVISVPTDGIALNRILLDPRQAHKEYFLPPGQAKKMGLWTPPGLAKKGGVPPGQTQKRKNSNSEPSKSPKNSKQQKEARKNQNSDFSKKSPSKDTSNARKSAHKK